jgi:hypothetical protein
MPRGWAVSREFGLRLVYPAACWRRGNLREAEYTTQMRGATRPYGSGHATLERAYMDWGSATDARP